MDFELTLEQKAVKEMARRFAEGEIVPAVRENDRKCRFPHEIIKKMAPMGLVGGPGRRRLGPERDRDLNIKCRSCRPCHRYCANWNR
ncbi:MAG: acyl-CoA dehydrogenase family protein [Candidatus Brocadiales bacterium]